MEIKGILKACVSSKNGTSSSTGNQWRTDEYLLVIPGHRTKHIKFEVRGEERCKQWMEFFNGMPDPNSPVLVRFEIDAREHDGKWFNSVEAWDICPTQW
jgi:hypothetical protein